MCSGIGFRFSKAIIHGALWLGHITKTVNGEFKHALQEKMWASLNFEHILNECSPFINRIYVQLISSIFSCALSARNSTKPTNYGIKSYH